MTNYIEHNNKIVFHPGYYIQELVTESGLSQEDFAKRLGTTPKNLSMLIRGKQSLSPDMAFRLSRLVGTSMEYWLNLQNRFDELVLEFQSADELVKEEKILDFIGYKYFIENFGLPELRRRKSEQVVAVRKFLGVASLTVFTQKDMAVSFRSASSEISEKNIVNANVMVQIAVNRALQIDAPDFDIKKFQAAVEYALTLTTYHNEFYNLIHEAFLESGVVFEILPNLPGSKINGATKKIGKSIMLMVNDRRLYSDIFWVTLYHEIGHIMNKDFGISFESDSGEAEEAADKYACNTLIPPELYKAFVEEGKFKVNDITAFAASIKRDPAIVLGRLQHDKFVRFDDIELNSLKKKYKLTNSVS